MLGIILCGGQSLRMGSDKGLLKLEAKTWVQTAIDKISLLNIPVRISVNNNQYPEYATLFSGDNLIADDTTLPLGGPLLGVLSCHKKYPTNDLFVLGCDMPFMELALLKILCKNYEQHQLYDVYIFTNNNEPEPLCGIYTAKGLSAIAMMLLNGSLIKHSMKFMLEYLHVFTMAVTEDQKKYFRNFNTHAPLNGL
ncbi:MAG: molybdenum cofactor guanylyltransferase [Ginsengibacter sp.]